MNINDLKLFKSICETQNFTKTSKTFFISQPAVTAAINRMEDELKTKLFKRNRFKQDVTLTQTGKLFETHVEQILKQLNQAYVAINTFEQLKPVQFGLPPMIGAYYFPTMVPSLVHEHLLSYMRIVEEGSQRMLSKLFSEEIDIALIASPDPQFSHEGIESVSLDAYPFKIIVAKDHPLAGKKNVTFEQIKDYPFISLKSNFLHRECLFNLFKKHRAKLTLASQTNQVQTMKSMVSMNAGIGLMSDLAIDPQKDALVALDLENEDLPLFNIFLCYPKDQSNSEISRKIIGLISGQCQADECMQ